MADFEIELNVLKAKKNSLTEKTGKVNQIVETYNGSSINKKASGINNVSANITKNMTRLNNGYKNSESWLNNYLTELETLEASLASFSLDTMPQINEFKGQFEDIFGKVTMPAIKTGGEPNINAPLGYIGMEHMISMTVDGQEFFVVDTKMSVTEYVEYIQKNKMYQNEGLLGGECIILSQYYAVDLMRGTKTSKSAMANKEGGPATRIKHSCRSDDINDVLEFAYNEVSAGRPVVLQVTQVNSNRGLRHLVTMVGFSKDVKSAADLTPDNILVLDCVDGEIQTLGKARSEGGHERQLFNQGNKGYYALGATTDFLSKEASYLTVT